MIDHLANFVRGCGQVPPKNASVPPNAAQLEHLLNARRCTIYRSYLLLLPMMSGEVAQPETCPSITGHNIRAYLDTVRPRGAQAS